MMIWDTPELRAALFPLLTGFVLVMGACIGSFLNVCIWRLPRGESLVSPPSHCPKCNKLIRPWENIPLLSWLCLRGRCSNCGLPISVRYPLVEAATSLLFLAVWLQAVGHGVPLVGIPAYLYLFAALFTISFTDYEHRFIPDAVVFPGYVVGLVAAALVPELHVELVSPRLGGNSTDVFTIGMLELLRLPELSAAGMAVANALCGILAGAGILWGLRLAGGFLWGEKKLGGGAGDRVVVDSAGRLVFPGFYEGEYAQFFAESAEVLHLRVSAVNCSLRDAAGQAVPPVAESAATGKTVLVSFYPEHVVMAGRTIPVAQVARLECTGVQGGGCRHEVMGLGDVKLLGMVGVFLGPDATFCVMFLSAALGALAGGAALVSHRRTGGGGEYMPFGMYVAVATAVWYFCGASVVSWYVQRSMNGL